MCTGRRWFFTLEGFMVSRWRQTCEEQVHVKKNVFKGVWRAEKRVSLILPEEFPQASWRLSLSVESIGSANMSERKEQSFSQRRYYMKAWKNMGHAENDERFQGAGDRECVYYDSTRAWGLMNSQQCFLIYLLFLKQCLLHTGVQRVSVEWMNEKRMQQEK